MAVEGIEQFYPELCFHALAHPEGFAQADVFVAAPKVTDVEREGGGAERERFVVHNHALCHITMPSRARREIRNLELIRIKTRIQRCPLRIEQVRAVRTPIEARNAAAREAEGCTAVVVADICQLPAAQHHIYQSVVAE